MSGTLAVVTGLVSSLEQVFGRGITIGGIALADMEVPEKMTWGGAQQLAVHRLIGGQRVVDAMGPDDRTLDWSGLMRGTFAVDRARQLDALRNSGAQQILTWDDFVYTVVVQNFEADYTRQGYRVPYRISCLIIPQPTAPSQPSLLQQIGSDINSAIGFNLTGDASTALTAAQAALPVAAVLTKGSSAYISLASAVGTASSAVGALQSASESQLGNLASSAGTLNQVIAGSDGLSAIAALQSAGSAAGSLATAVTAGAYLSRVTANMNSASS